MRIELRAITITALLIATAASSATSEPGRPRPRQPAQTPDRLTFRNNLLPGHLTRHGLTRVIRRTAPRPEYVHSLTYEKRSDWVQCNIDEPRPGHVKVYHMIADQPTRILRVFHGDKEITPTPEPAEFNLIDGSASLYDAVKTPYDAPYLLPTTEPVEKAVLRTMLDCAHWEKKRVESGQRWQRPIDGDGFSGTQTYEFIDLGKIGGDVAGRVTLYVEGRFTGSLDRDYEFDKAQAIIYWSRLDRVLLKMEGRAEFRRRRPTGADEYELKLDIALTERRQLDTSGQNAMIDQLTAFAAALTPLHGGHPRDTVAACKAFRSRWPNSVWMPAVDALERRANPPQTASARMSQEQLVATLLAAGVTWDAACKEEDYDRAARTVRALRLLAADNRSKLAKLAGDDDEARRAPAVFGLAFSRRAADMTTVMKAARDSSPRVRSMALAGLAAVRYEEIDPQVLAILLEDPEPSVRRRACQAAAACIAPERLVVPALVEKVNHLIVHDKNAGVRREAVRTLAAIGAPADVQKLEKALHYEFNRGLRDEINRAIDRLKARG